MILFWTPLMILMISHCYDCPYPTGICRIYSFSFLFTIPGKIFLILFILFAISLYLFEKRMILATAMLFMASCIITSYHESNGIFYRSTALSAVFGVQFIAYLINFYNPASDLKRNRIHFPVQVIAALYTVAGISKLRASGLGWINSGELFPLQILKNYAFLYYDTGVENYLQQGKSLAYTMIRNQFFTKLVLAFSLFIELTCFIATFSERSRVVYGIGLLFMHIGIYFIMSIGPSNIAFPMVIFFLNPLYLIFRYAGVSPTTLSATSWVSVKCLLRSFSPFFD